MTIQLINNLSVKMPPLKIPAFIKWISFGRYITRYRIYIKRFSNIIHKVIEFTSQYIEHTSNDIELLNIHDEILNIHNKMLHIHIATLCTPYFNAENVHVFETY